MSRRRLFIITGIALLGAGWLGYVASHTFTVSPSGESKGQETSRAEAQEAESTPFNTSDLSTRGFGPADTPQPTNALEETYRHLLPPRWRQARILDHREDADGMELLLEQEGFPYPIAINLPHHESADRQAFVAHRWLLKAEGEPATLRDKLLQLPGIRAVETFGPAHWYRIEMDQPVSLADRERLRGILVEAYPESTLEGDAIVHHMSLPDDPAFVDGLLWGLRNTGQGGGIAGTDISATDGWGSRSRAGGVVIGVVDSGIHTSHEDLAANLWTNPGEIAGNGVDDDGNGYIDDLFGIDTILDSGQLLDDNSHGTHVSGTIGAEGNNGIGTVGVAWEVQLMGLKFLSAFGSGAISDAMEGIQYARQFGVTIFNNSWGGSFPSAAFEDFNAGLEEEGVIMVVAAGNSSSDNSVSATFPANLPHGNIIAVAAHNRAGELASFSNFGKGWVDISAPGVDIYSAGSSSDQQYELKRGTSMATPHVTGVLALLQATFPEDAPEALVNRLLNGATSLPALDGKVTGDRSLNLPGALTADPHLDHDLPTAPYPLRASFARERIRLAGANVDAADGAWPEKVQKVVWMQWSTPVPGTSIIDTFESAADTFIRVYNNPLPDPEFLVAENDDARATSRSEVAFQAEAGKDYLIGIGTPAMPFGTLIVQASGPPPNDMLADAESISANQSGLSGSNRNGAKEDGEPDHAGVPGGASVWYKWIPPASATWSFLLQEASSPMVMALYRGPSQNPSFDDLIPVVASDPEAPGSASMKVATVEGETLYLCIDSINQTGGTYAVVIRQPPINDDFAERIALLGSSIEREGDARSATSEPGEPQHHPRSTGNSLWYSYQPPTAGDYRIRALGNFASTTLALYTGTSLDALTQLASDYNSGEQASSEVILKDVDPDTTYLIAVDGVEPFPGPYTLFIDPVVLPDNDFFDEATPLPPSLPVILEGTNVGAGFEPGEPGGGDFGQTNSIWFRWIVPATGRFLVDTRGSSFTTRLDVYTGESLADLRLLGSSSFANADNTSEVVFQAYEAQSLHFRVTGENNQSGQVHLSLRSFTPPANDAFSGATVVVLNPLEGNTFADPFNNTGATREPGEPWHAFHETSGTESPGEHTLWWRYTPTPHQAGRTTASAIGPGRTSCAIAVYTGSAVHNLQPVAKSHRYLVYGSGQVTWEAIPGTTYQIAVAANGDPGESQLTLQGPFPSDSIASAYAVQGTHLRLTGWNINATKEPGEPRHADDDGGRSIWYRWTPPTSEPYRISTENSRVLYSNQVTLNTTLAIYRGSSVSNLALMTANDDRTTRDNSSEVILQTTAGVPVLIAVDGWNPTFGEFFELERADQGRIVLDIAPVSPPDNDAFAEAFELTRLPAFEERAVAGGSFEAREPVHDGVRKRSVWYRWTAPVSGTVVAATAGNLYNDFRARQSVVAAYTGDALDTLRPVLLDPGFPESGGNGVRVIRFQASAGETYFFAVDDGGTASYSNLAFFLDWAPINDAFALATPIEGSRATVNGHNVGSEAEPGEPVIPDPSYANPDNRPPPTSVWWKWTAPASGTVTLDTYGSEIYSTLAVFTGDNFANLTRVAYENTVARDPLNGLNRDRNGTAFLDFNAVKGTTYHIQVAGDYYDRSSQGPIVLSLEGPRPVPLPPTRLTASTVDADAIALEWSPVTDATQFRIERQEETGTGVWTGIGEAATGTGIVDRGLQPSTLYRYRVRTENETGVSAWRTSEPVSTLDNRLQGWRLHWFDTLESTGSAAGGADPDEDGLNNLIEFWLDLDPTMPSNVPSLPSEANNDRVHWNLPPLSHPLQFTLSGSTDLETWIQNPEGLDIEGHPTAAPWRLSVDPELVPFWRLLISEGKP